MIKFITGNKGKLTEAQQILGDVEGLDIDLPEIQEIDPKKIIAAKLEEAQKHQSGEYIVEDTSLYVNALDGLPGPLIKWFSKTIGDEKLARIAELLDDNNGKAITMIGYISQQGEIKYFPGEINGKIVTPKGHNGFGWDPIFKPEGCSKTFAEMDTDEKNTLSMRKVALEKLKRYLDER